jgi:hypothetical protein
MNRWCKALLVWAVLALPARAHFIWIVPVSYGNATNMLRVVFSDTLKPDSPELLKKIGGAEFFVRDASGRTTPLHKGDGGDAYVLAIPAGDPCTIAGVCRYGVSTHGGAEPFLLMYYPKVYQPVAPSLGQGTAPWDRLALEIVPVQGPALTCQVLWHGKPVAGAEVVALATRQGESTTLKTDEKGQFRCDMTKAGGLYGLRVRHDEAREGTLNGKTYKTVRHYATLVLEAPDRAAVEGDPEATRLLADARAARANWSNFPGFSADVTVNLDGREAQGHVTVDAKGKVHLDLADHAAATWARPMLASIVGHRLDNGQEAPTECLFADDNQHHPLGRAIRVVGDDYHSSYRVRDRQILVVNRTMNDVRFSITVMENRVNEQNQFLPACFTVSTWDLKTNALKSSQTHHQTWQRVGRFDLPETTTVVTAGSDKLETRTLKLSNVKLAQ